MEQNNSNQDIFMDAMQNNTKNSSEEMKETVSISAEKIVEWGCYVLGVIFVIIAFVKMGKDLDYNDNPFSFYEHRYVGGDAYNYIISAARSSAVMVNSLIWMVAGCSALIIGRITTLINKK